MAEITAQMVMQLREQTGAGMMDAKKALVEAEGDIERARDILRSKGQASAAKRAERAAADGVVSIASSDKSWTMVELNSETDFVARNEEFRALADEIAQTHAHNPGEDVAALMETKTASGQTVRQKVDDALAKMRENLVLRRTVRFDIQPDSVIGDYIHRVDHKTGVLVELQGDPENPAHKELARNIAMHVAANKPEFLSREEVPADAVEREKTVLAELTRNEGKPEAAIPKIVEGRIGKYFERVALIEQPYVRDQSKKIGQLAEEAGAKVRRFALFVVGQ